MAYNPRQKKISQFVKGVTLTDATAVSSVQDGANKTFTMKQILDKVADVYGASLRTYEFESQLVADDIALGEYAIVEENSYGFYKVTSDAVTGQNIALTSGLTAKFVTYVSSSITVTPEMFGAAGDGGTLDYTAWSRMIEFALSTGAKMEGKPGSIYLLANASTAADSTLFDLSNCDYFDLNLRGSTIKTITTAGQNTINMFFAQDGKNISIGNGIIDTTLLVNGTFDPIGIQFFLGYDKCTNIKISDLSGPGGVATLVAFERSNTGSYLPYEDQAKQILIKNIDFSAVGYLGNFRFNGSDVTGENIKVDYAHRVWFPYGVRNHKAHIISRDTDATFVRIWGVEGQDTTDMEFYIDVSGGDTLRSAVNMVSIAFNGGGSNTSVIARHKFHFKADGNGNLGNGVAVVLENPVTGLHTLEDISFSGDVSNLSNRGITFSEQNSATIANDLMVNKIRFENFHIDSQVSGSVFPISNSSTDHIMRNCSIKNGVNQNFIFSVDGSSYDNTIVFDSVEGGQVHANSVDTAKSSYENCRLSSSTGQDLKNSLYKNTEITGLGLLEKTAFRYVVSDAGSIAQNSSIGYRFINQASSTTMVITLTKGTYCYPDLLPSSLHSPATYSFVIGLRDGSNRGQFMGNVIMQSNGTDITFIALANVTVTNIAGAAYSPGQLAVSISSGSPVFTLTSGSSVYGLGEMCVREV